MREDAGQDRQTPSQNGHAACLSTLGRTGWLAHQPAGFQRKIASMGRWITVPAGKRIYSCGDPSEGLIGIDQGFIDVMAPLSNDEEYVFYRAVAGDWLGDGGLLFGEPRQLSIEAVTTCRFFQVPHTRLRPHLDKHPQDWACLFHLATNRMMLAANLVSDLIALPPQARIARLLLRLQKRNGEVISKQEDLAKLVGVSRATFRRAIEHLVKAGAIAPNYGRLTITDKDALARAANL